MLETLKAVAPYLAVAAIGVLILAIIAWDVLNHWTAKEMVKLRLALQEHQVAARTPSEALRALVANLASCDSCGKQIDSGDAEILCQVCFEALKTAAGKEPASTYIRDQHARILEALRRAGWCVVSGDPVRFIDYLRTEKTKQAKEASERP